MTRAWRDDDGGDPPDRRSGAAPPHDDGPAVRPASDRGHRDVAAEEQGALDGPAVIVPATPGEPLVYSDPPQDRRGLDGRPDRR